MVALGRSRKPIRRPKPPRQGQNCCVSAGRAAGNWAIPKAPPDWLPAHRSLSAKRAIRFSTAIGAKPTRPSAASPYRKGHRLPEKFDPPVHWNELYDNKLFGWEIPMPKIIRNCRTTPKIEKSFISAKDMEIEAEKARELGCGCLYLDPGWDTSFGSNIWAEDRLGPQADFVRWLKEKYGMKLALHTPLAPWSDPASYPPEARRMDKAGNRIGELCTASPAYIETKVARLKELCKHGAYFLMYDGSWFPGECWDKSHGHSLPITHQEHVDAILQIQQKLHEEYPAGAHRAARSDDRAGHAALHADLLHARQARRVRRAVGIRVHDRSDGRHPHPPGVLALLPQSGLRNSRLSAHRSAKGQRECPRFLVVRQHLPAFGR